MPIYTVLGYYDNDGMARRAVVEADDAYAAMTKVAKADMENGDDGVCIIGAIEGEHALITPGEDNFMSAMVEDLAGNNE